MTQQQLYHHIVDRAFEAAEQLAASSGKPLTQTEIVGIITVDLKSAAVDPHTFTSFKAAAAVNCEGDAPRQAQVSTTASPDTGRARSKSETVHNGMLCYQAEARSTAIYPQKIEEITKVIHQLVEFAGENRKYQLAAAGEKAARTVSNLLRLWYPILGLLGEAGEVANKAKKMLRDGQCNYSDLKAETGDALWYVADLATALGASLGEVATDNLQKLDARNRRGTLQGKGDGR